MKNWLVLILSIMVLGGAGGVYADELPPCPDNQPKEKWDNCTGTATYLGRTGSSKYVGEFKDGKWHGQGTFAFDGNKYVGEFKDNKTHGYGTFTMVVNGEEVYEYVGEVKENKMHGYGTQTWAIGNKYVGEYKDGKKHGYGTHTWASGTTFEGLWKEDEPSGAGIVKSLNGNELHQRYFNPLTTEQFGDLYYANGDIIKDAYFKNGVLKGYWKDGEFVSSSSPVANFLKEVIVGTVTGLPKAYVKNKVESKAREKAYKKGYEEGKRKGRKRGPQPLPKNEP